MTFRLVAHNVITSGPILETKDVDEATAAFKKAVADGYRNVVLRLIDDRFVFRGER